MPWSYSYSYQPSMTRSSTATTLPAPNWEPTSTWWTMQVSVACKRLLYLWATESDRFPLIFWSGHLTAAICTPQQLCRVFQPQMPAACPSRFMPFPQLRFFSRNAALSADIAEWARLRPQQLWVCVYFWCFPLQRLSSSQSPAELRRSCQCPLWLKTTALILCRITTAILTDFPCEWAPPCARAQTQLGFVACVVLRKDNRVFWVCFFVGVMVSRTFFYQYEGGQRKIDLISKDQ